MSETLGRAGLWRPDLFNLAAFTGGVHRPDGRSTPPDFAMATPSVSPTAGNRAAPG
jgi:hypothetical protein